MTPKEFITKVWGWIKDNPVFTVVAVPWTIVTIASVVGGISLIPQHKINGIAIILVSIMGYIAIMSILWESQKDIK